MAPAPGFARVRWDAAEPVEITTLDALIAAHGLPRFVKIDVEGFEAEVLAGLTAAAPWVAFEYLPPALDSAHACVARLAALGPYAYTFVPGEPWSSRCRLAARRRFRRHAGRPRPRRPARRRLRPARRDAPAPPGPARAAAALALSPLVLAQPTAPARSLPAPCCRSSCRRSSSC